MKNLDFRYIVQEAFKEPNKSNLRNYFTRWGKEAQKQGYDLKTFAEGMVYGLHYVDTHHIPKDEQNFLNELSAFIKAVENKNKA
ncbi:MAG: hypothetical protein KF900_06915 [Bacteroidetes bacterium]|nr:hypothetical protein [Bacteroidota bacterium]